jgi:hypothetical protein
MRVKFINKDFGIEMFVDESRIEEYKAAGHKLAADLPAAKNAEPKPEKKPAARRSSKKK